MVKPCVLPSEYCEIIVIVLSPKDDVIFASPVYEVDETKPFPKDRAPVPTWSFPSEISVKTKVPSL